MSSTSVKTKNKAERSGKNDKRQQSGSLPDAVAFAERERESDVFGMFAFARIYVVCAVWCLLYCHYPFFSNSRFVCVRQVYLCLCLRSRLLSFAVRFCLPAILPLLLFTFVPSSLWAQVSWVELSWFVRERQHNRQQQCVSIHSHQFFSLSRSLSGKDGKWCRCCGFVIPCSAVTVRIWSNGSRMWNKMNSCSAQPHTHT